MSNTTIPKGSTVLVTGANGYIPTHVVDLLLRLGYAVKGTVRTAQKGEVLETTFRARHPTSSFQAVLIADINVPGAVDAAIEGCSGIVHMANSLASSPNYDAQVTGTINAMKNLLESASKTPSIKRFVYTSSTVAAGHPVAGKAEHLTSESWNRVYQGKLPLEPPYPKDYGLQLYSIAKVACEEAAQEFVKTREPSFVYNSVLPNVNFGPILTPENGGMTAAAAAMGVFYGIPEAIGAMSNEEFWAPQQMVDVRDTAWLHVLALTEEDVKSERLISAAEPYNYNRVIELMSSFVPEGHKLPEKKEGLSEVSQTSDSTRQLELLKRVGRNGWAPVVRALRENCFGEGK